MNKIYIFSSNIHTIDFLVSKIESIESAFEIIIVTQINYINDNIMIHKSEDIVKDSSLHDILNINFSTDNVYFTIEEALITFVSSFQNRTNQKLCLNPLIFTDKKIMKLKLIDKKINTANVTIQPYNTQPDLDAINYPIIVKPLNGAASVGVKKITSSSEFKLHMRKMHLLNNFILNKKEEYLIEEFIEGMEYSVDTLWRNGKNIFSVVCLKGKNDSNDFSDRMYLVHDDFKHNLIDFSIKVGSSLGILNGMTHTEIIDRDDTLYCIESTCRPGGGAFLLECASRKHGVDYIDIYLRSLMKLDYTFNEKSIDNKKFFFYNCPFWFNKQDYHKEFDEIISKFDLKFSLYSFLNDEIDENEDLTLSYKNLVVGQANKYSNSDISFIDDFAKHFERIKNDK